MSFANILVFRQIPAGLAHDPHRNTLDGFATACTQKQIPAVYLCSDDGGRFFDCG